VSARVAILEPADEQHVQGGSRDHTELTVGGDRPGQRPVGHADSHAALDDDWMCHDAEPSRARPASDGLPSVAQVRSCLRTTGSATGASYPERRHRHSVCRLEPVRCTVRFDSPQPYLERMPMLRTANETCHESVFDRMAGCCGGNGLPDGRCAGAVEGGDRVGAIAGWGEGSPTVSGE